MKKVVFFLLIFFPIIASAEDFNSVVDFSVELSTLADRDRTLEIAQDGRIVVLEGVTEDVMMTGDSPSLKLLGGEWIGSEEVRAYTCLFSLNDRKWKDIFPAERPEDPEAGYVPPGSHLLVVARILGWNDETGEPLAEILDYRVLK